LFRGTLYLWAVCAAFVLITLMSSMRIYNAPKGGSPIWLTIVAAGAAACAFATSVAAVFYDPKVPKYVLCPNGFIVDDGAERQTYFWDDIGEYHRIGRWSELRLTTLEDRSVVLHHEIQGRDAFYETVRRRVDQSLFERNLMRIANGETAHFGPFSVNVTGVEFNGSVTPWHLVDSLTFTTSLDMRPTAILVTTIGSKKHWINADDRTIPNLNVAHEIIKRLDLPQPISYRRSAV
jgi:hypothetical protein